MKSRICDKLDEIEKENDVSILYACESGSRAWGFDNDHSDYDVRFIYKRNSLKDYLTLTDRRDVIEFDDGTLDIVGWDIKKSLFLHYKSNPNLREWIVSPVKYIDFKADIFAGLPDFDDSTLKHHYFSIARNNWKRLCINPQITERDIKMYLYNCRCILTYMAIDEGINPSINIFELLNQVDCDIHDDILALINYYKGNCRGDFGVGGIHYWMAVTLSSLDCDFPKNDKSRDLKEYDERFYQLVKL